MKRSLCLGVAMLMAAAPALAQTFIGRNFTGSTFLTDSNFRTPDTMGATGVDYFVELINGRFSVYRKSDGVRVQTSTLNQFWINAGQTPTGDSFDPRVVYDPHARRFYAVAVDNGTNANDFLFAVSNSSDPTQAWTAFKIDSDTDDSNWADFPMIGYNPEAVYVSANMKRLTATDDRNAYLVIPKFGLLQPTPTIAGFSQLEDVSHPPFTHAWSPQLAVDASNAIGINSNMPMLMHDFVTQELYRAEIISPGLPTITNIGVVGVPALPDPPTVDQPGPKQNIEANDGRFSSNTVLHNGEIYGVQTIDNGGLATLRFLRLDAATNAVLESQIIVDPASRALTFPSVAVNEFGDVVIGVTGTSTTEFPSSYALVGKTVGGITTFNAPMLLHAGVSDYQVLDTQMPPRNRWGDYSATTVDPADPGIFWTTQEFVSSANRWSTRITELIVLQPGEARWAASSGGMFDDPTMWQTASGALPLPSEHLIFSRATEPGPPPMPMTIVLPSQPPGTYAYQSLSARQGEVVLDLAGNQLDLALHLEVGPYYGAPLVTVANGTVNSVAGFIAHRPTSEGTLVLDNTHWIVSADVRVGSPPQFGSVVGLPGATGGIGTLTIDNNSRLDIGATLQIWGHAAVNLIDGVLTAQTIQQNAPPLPGGVGFGLNFTGGTLEVERFEGILINSGGSLAPGGSGIGTTEVTLDYLQLAGASLDINISGVGPGQYDQLIAGLAEFSGSLDLVLAAGYAPTLSDTFQIVTAGMIPAASAANLLTNTVFPNIGPRLGWHLFHQPTALTLAIVPALTGDFNADGVVDSADYVVWRNQSGQTAFGLAADANLDGQVNLIDYLLWRTHFGQAVPASGASPVPEPGAAGLLVFALLGGSGMLYWRHRLPCPPAHSCRALAAKARR